MYNIKKEWKSFNISLDKLSDQLKADFPEHATNPVFKGIQACGDSADGEVKGYIEFWFDKTIEGYGKDEEGNITTEADSHAETIETLWDNIDEAHEIATEYVCITDINKTIERAKSDAVIKTYDQLTVEQKKLIVGVSLTCDDKKQILIDFPEV